MATHQKREGIHMRFQMRRAAYLSAVAIVAVMAGSAGATPVSIGIGDFSGSETVIEFTGVVPGAPITNQFAAQGATFSGGLYGFPIGEASNFDLFL